MPWAESGATAALMATGTVLNECVAHRALAGLPAAMVPARRAKVVGLGMQSVLAGWLVG